MKKLFFLLTIVMVIFTSCQNNPNVTNASQPLSAVPHWAEEVVWYQIFVERFCNGDTTNDPTTEDIRFAYPDSIPADWAITPWTQDWYKADAYFAHTGLTKFQDNLQLRRYGGDLQGVLNKLDYLSDLGISAIYFNPLNDAPSMHKYDPRYWHHIDRNFGPNPREDARLMKNETQSNPDNWIFTHADSLFLKVINACHQRGIKVIVDYSWNHSGMDFWALNDIRKNGKDSPFADWYDIESFDNPATPEDEFKYKGWYHIKYLPEMRKKIIGQDSIFPFNGNLASQAAKDHIFAVAARWLDPNKDGNPNDGIDGFRLDVAAEIPMGFWPEFRQKVRAINPQAYLVGEVWWQKWPDELMDPRPFLKDSMFDAIMNYRWYRCAHQFFAQAEPAIGAKAFADSLEQLLSGIDASNNRVLMNLTSSHDSPRTLTSLFNTHKYKYNAKPYDDPNYKVNKPDSLTFKKLKMLWVHQFTYIGAPHIWYGDEVGMWGADDPDTRKPMVWSELSYANESHHPIHKVQPPDAVFADTGLYQFVKKLIRIRNENPCLVYGDFKVLVTNDTSMLFIYQREYQNQKIKVVMNNSTDLQVVQIPEYSNIDNLIFATDNQMVLNESGWLTLPPFSAGIIK